MQRFGAPNPKIPVFNQIESEFVELWLEGSRSFYSVMNIVRTIESGAWTI